VIPSSQAPRCEACGREPACSFSWFADRARWYEPRSGTWRFTCYCTADRETYYVLLHNRGHGFLDSAESREHWLQHLAEKRWFDSADFLATLGRFEAAGGAVPRLETVRNGGARGR
jgi:hypothetical protein